MYQVGMYTSARNLPSVSELSLVMQEHKKWKHGGDDVEVPCIV